MARPQKNTVDYFPFYCEDGSKMFYIEETYGNDGFATFIKILKELARVEYHYLDLSKKSSVMFLSAKCKVSIDVLEAIISDLVMLEKFDSVLWNENKIIWCESFIESIQDAYAKRTNKCIDRNGLLHLLDSLGVRKLDKQKPKPAKGTGKGEGKPQTILEDTITDESIEDESIENNPPQSGFSFKNSLIELGIEKEVVEEWLKIRKKLKAVDSEISFKAIKREIEKSNFSPNECILKAVEKSWRGFEAGWITPEPVKKTGYPPFKIAL
jgi:hypothetical protein